MKSALKCVAWCVVACFACDYVIIPVAMSGWFYLRSPAIITIGPVKAHRAFSWNYVPGNDAPKATKSGTFIHEAWPGFAPYFAEFAIVEELATQSPVQNDQGFERMRSHFHNAQAFTVAGKNWNCVSYQSAEKTAGLNLLCQDETRPVIYRYAGPEKLLPKAVGLVID